MTLDIEKTDNEPPERGFLPRLRRAREEVC